jgi:hypothetical protein
VSRLGDRDLVRRRYAAATWTAGRPTAGAVTETAFVGSPQPMRGADRQVLPEGVRQRESLKVYCDQGTLRTADQHAGVPADEVEIDTVRYTVVHIDSTHALIPHDRAFLVRVQEEP